MEKRARKKKKTPPIKPDNHLRILPRFDKEVGENDDVQMPLLIFAAPRMQQPLGFAAFGLVRLSYNRARFFSR